jgi:DNA-binding PadR family transcriptional regulator
MNDQIYLSKLLESWELTHKKGQMSQWIFLSLCSQARCPEEIGQFIVEQTEGKLSYDEQSIYRALRKFDDLELLDFEMRDGNRGPQRKYYSLTENGKKLFKTFLENHLIPMYSHKYLQLLQDTINHIQ